MPDRRPAPVRSERAILAAIIASAFAARAVALWLTRPEFVGWFNHCYYYWVQVRGLLATGQLPYADLPLLFYVYTAEASVLHLFGMDLPRAIITATRLTMSLAPALIAYPIYRLFRGVGDSQPLSFEQWSLVAASAFLPLTFAHMPELLQKNTLGIVLLSGFTIACHGLCRQRSPRSLAAVVSLFVLIAVSHLGTLAATLLFCLSLALAVIREEADRNQIMASVAIVAALSVLGLMSVYGLDPEAFGRVLHYARSSLEHSLLAGLWSSDPATSKLACSLGIMTPLAGVLLLWRSHAGQGDSLNRADRIFWSGNLLFIYLLMLPIIDRDVVMRLALFMPLPILVVLNYHLLYDGKTPRTRVLVGVASVGAALMLLGETMNLVMRDPDKAEIHQALLDLKQRYQLSEDDLVLTTYGVNPICNWFLNARAGLITAFNAGDRDLYGRVFVLNPRELPVVTDSMGSRSGDRISFRTNEERYGVTRRQILMPSEAVPLVTNGQLDFYRLRTIPNNWLLDDAGDWIGYVAADVPSAD